MTRARRIVAVVAAVLVLSGCAVATDDAWTPRQWAPAAVAVAEVPSPIAPPPSLIGTRVRNDAVGVQARVALAPGGDTLNARLLALVRDAVAARSQASGAAYRPQVSARGAGLGDRACVPGSTLLPAPQLLADPALGPPGGSGTAIACDIVAAAGSLLGQRMRVVTGDAGGVAADTTVVLYTDLASGETVAGGELWLPDAAVALWDRLVDALRRDAGSLSLAPVAPPAEAALAEVQAALATAVPAPDGSLVLTLPRGFTAPELVTLGVPPEAQARTVGLPPEVSADLVTPLGAALVGAVAQNAPFAPPPAPLPAVDCALLPCVAVTYDDGPGPYTADVLDAYADGQSSATFFVLGGKVAGAADLLTRMVAEGHEVANHTWNHPHLPRLSAAAVGRQIRDASAAIAAVTGRPVTSLRPPYGEYDAAVAREARLPLILWDVDTSDYLGPADEELVARAVDRPQPGSIVLQHDTQPVTGRTAAAVIAGLRDRGFSLVTVSQLFGGSLPASGVWRSAR